MPRAFRCCSTNLSTRSWIRFVFRLMIAITVIVASGFCDSIALDIVQLGDPPNPDLALCARRFHPLLLVLCCVGLALAICVAFFGAHQYERGVAVAVAIIMISGALALALRMVGKVDFLLGATGGYGAEFLPISFATL